MKLPVAVLVSIVSGFFSNKPETVSVTQKSGTLHRHSLNRGLRRSNLTFAKLHYSLALDHREMVLQVMYIGDAPPPVINMSGKRIALMHSQKFIRLELSSDMLYELRSFLEEYIKRLL